MNLAGYAVSLGENRSEPGFHLSHAQTIELPNE